MTLFRTLLALAAATSAVACSDQTSTTEPSQPETSSTATANVEQTVKAQLPADKFDLSQWKIAVPLDADNDGSVDQIGTEALQTYSHPDYFYLDDDGNMVFAAPNKATTTANSSNTRSELHRQYRGMDPAIGSYDPANNFALAAHPNAEAYAAVGGRMEATLKVNHVAENAKYPNKPPAFSVVVGQIHATKDQKTIDQGNGFGYGNEPLKIYYKKWPNHDTGSVFWNYELNLPKKDPKRRDISYVVWGNAWDNPEAPGEAGIALGEEFSYVVNVYENTMYLTFSAEGKETVHYAINLADNTDPYGKVDPDDHPQGYAGDAHFFKAGAYNQCSTKDAPGVWYAACAGTGDWKTDKANGDYVSVAFSRLELSPSVPMNAKPSM